MNYLIRVIAVFALFFTIGCAHQIIITPPLNTLDADGITKIDKNVGYYISLDDLSKEVITPGGGGDKVKYFPYKESEPALKTVLSNIFINVYVVPSLDDIQFITSNNISYIFIPKIDTDSWSRSNWIWPPTEFIVTLDCKANDSSGNVIWQKEIMGEAHMAIPDVYNDRSLAGRVATEKAFSELQKEILNADIFQ